jgi:hypothetical protein
MSGDEQGPLTARGYSVGGTSLRGALHERRGLRNQDAIRWQQRAEGELPIVLAISDGHGSASYFRSDVGAACAVAVALEVGSELAVEAKGPDHSTVKREVEERLPQQIARLWSERVAKHLSENPLTDEEREWLTTDAGARARERIERDGSLIYGATLLFVIVASRFIVFGQLGDGDLLWVEASGETSILFESAPDDVGEETASLCMKDAWRYFKVKVVPIHEDHPPLLLISTDGYSKSFINNAEFRRIGADYLKMVRERGVEQLRTDLPGFLADATQRGSGDDITLGFIRCSEDDDYDSRIRQRAELEARLENKVNRGEVESLKASVEKVQTQVSTVEALAAMVAVLVERVGRLEAGFWRTVVAARLGSLALVLAAALLWYWLRSGR